MRISNYVLQYMIIAAARHSKALMEGDIKERQTNIMNIGYSVANVIKNAAEQHRKPLSERVNMVNQTNKAIM